MHQRDIHLFTLYRSLDINQLRRQPLIFVRMNIFMSLTQFSDHVHDDHGDRRRHDALFDPANSFHNQL